MTLKENLRLAYMAMESLCRAIIGGHDTKNAWEYIIQMDKDRRGLIVEDKAPEMLWLLAGAIKSMVEELPE